MAGADVFLEDLNSTNGTYVNGKAIKKQLLQDGDTIEVGKYKIKFVGDAVVQQAEVATPAPVRPAVASPPAPAAVGSSSAQAAVKVLSGAAAGREVPLTKVVTTIGKPGVAVAAITRRSNGFVVHHVEGAGNPTLNGAAIGAEPVPLKSGDVIELAGTQMQFVQS
jgi:pSer/pThr/pTyr-binding forkhead associated (FHA) protein